MKNKDKEKYKLVKKYLENYEAEKYGERKRIIWEIKLLVKESYWLLDKMEALADEEQRQHQQHVPVDEELLLSSFKHNIIKH